MRRETIQKVMPVMLKSSFRRLMLMSAPLAAISLLGGCGLFGDDGPVQVAAIGALHRNPDQAPAPLSLPNRLLMDATAQGLVSFAADGQIEAGLAERWTVIDDGKSYIFRLREAHWSDGRPVRAADVAAILRQKMASPRLRSPLRGEFAGVRGILARTAKVIEIQLDRPQPALLDLLAQPDMALMRRGHGWGPWRAQWQGGTATLSAVPLMTLVEGERGDEAEEDIQPLVQLWGTNSVRAVTQFDSGAADAVLGGRFEGWPLVVAAGIPREAAMIDPVDGLFGLAIVQDRDLLGDALVRDAIGMAIDRQRLVDALGIEGWLPRITVRPQRTGNGVIDPIYPAWVDFSRAERMRRARDIIADWRARNGGVVPRVRIALPDGPGSRILFAWINTDLAAVGIEARRVPLSANADLRLIDDLAPSSDEAWYVRRLGCDRGLSCDRDAQRLINAITEAEDPADRATAIQAAEEAVTRHAGFIPLAAPVRWSLVSNRAPGLRSNNRGRHSLIRLRPPPD
jgi:peptide/nickel transport system substrate-binding protein